VDIFGPSNLVSLLENFPEYLKPWMPFWYKYVGDPGNLEDHRKMEDFLAEHFGGRSAGFDYYELGLLIF